MHFSSLLAKNYTMVQTNWSIFISVIFYFILSISLSPIYVFLAFIFVWYFDQVVFLAFISICSNSKRVTICMVKKLYTSKAKIYISFFFLSSHLLLVPFLGLLLFFFIIYFYLINITYKYNKLLCIQWLLSYWSLNY